LTEIGATISTLQNNLVSQLNRYATAQYNEITTLDASVQEYLQSLSDYFSDTDVRPWFQWNTEVRNVAWRCVTNYDFYGNTFDVLWVCAGAIPGSSFDRVFAVATAVYHDDTKRFSDLTVYLTSVGEQYMHVSKGGV
jgi:hypothetical protein